jgi:BlaI family penicillinase repressor
MKSRAASAVRVRGPLTDLEHDVMHAVWDAGPSAVEDVHRVIARTRSLKEATTRTILRRLEQKGYLTHTAQGRAYVYRAVEPRHNLAARAVRQIIDRFCRGSVEELVSGMVDAKLLTKAELDTLEEVVRQRRRQVKGQDVKKGH